MTRITLALALALAAIAVAPASAQVSANPYQRYDNVGQEHTCGSQYLDYDSSGAPTGPYCH